MGVGVEIRKLERDELWRVGEIDRTERLDVLFEQRGTQLVARTGNWDAPAWYADGQGEHSVASQVRAVEHYVDAGGVALGAFAGERWLASALSSRTSDQGSRSSPSFTSARIGRGFASGPQRSWEDLEMPKMQQYTVEFKDQAVRFVFEANESRKEACRRLAPKVNVKEVTLYNWVKAASPVTSGGAARGVVRAATPGPLPTASTIAASSRSASARLPRTVFDR